MMTYRERFTASEERAHNQNIATKILREMSDLRSSVEASPSAPKRWVWELIQNAKDLSIGGKIRILIEAEFDGDEQHVTFKHNGQPFSAENIRFLIEQISSKDRKKDETGRQKTTGKFGTGFLTTHLLSEVVLVEGVAKEQGLDARKFELLLDRSGFDLDSITEAVKKAKNSVQDLDDKPPYRRYVAGAFNTSFRYELADDTGRNVAREQLSELLAEYDVQSVQELRNVLAKQAEASQLLPLTQEIIATMGITSVEEWTEALKDKDLTLLFSHKSTPTTDMFVYAQTLIEHAKKRIIEHLQALDDYDLGEIEETAPTVLAGIRKDGRQLMVVARPAYDGEVIIYYGSERDVLDFEDSELWIDDGQSVRRITLGHLLKTTQIRRFPV